MLKISENIFSYLIAVIFSYSFFIKVQDFINFKKKMFQSELINNDLVPLFSYTIPFIEITIAMCILFNIKKSVFLYISFFVLIIFTIYLIALNEYSLFNGCSCGGIFENLTYFQHIIVNLTFIIFNFLAIVLSRLNNKRIKHNN